MKKKSHKISGREIDCNIACKKDKAPKRIKEQKKRKIFIGGLSENSTNGNFIF